MHPRRHRTTQMHFFKPFGYLFKNLLIKSRITIDCLLLKRYNSLRFENRIFYNRLQSLMSLVVIIAKVCNLSSINRIRILVNFLIEFISLFDLNSYSISYSSPKLINLININFLNAPKEFLEILIHLYTFTSDESDHIILIFRESSTR